MLPKLEVQESPFERARVSDLAEDRADADLLAHGFGDRSQVSDERVKALAVIDDDEVSVATEPTRVDDLPPGDGDDRASRRRADVEALVGGHRPELAVHDVPEADLDDAPRGKRKSPAQSRESLAVEG